MSSRSTSARDGLGNCPVCVKGIAKSEEANNTAIPVKSDLGRRQRSYSMM